MTGQCSTRDNIRTLSERNRETERETERQRSSSSSTTSTSTTTSSYHTEPGVFLADEDLEAIRTAYNGVLGALNYVTARDIEWAIRNGLQASAILDAIDQTALAPRPSHYYLRAILRRYVTERITTAEAAEDQRHRRRAERDQANAETWGAWYRDPSANLPW